MELRGIMGLSNSFGTTNLNNSFKTNKKILLTLPVNMSKT